MATITYYVAIPFERAEDGTLAAGEAMERPNADAAKRSANALAAKYGGAVAFQRRGDPDVGEFDPAELLATYGGRAGRFVRAMNREQAELIAVEVLTVISTDVERLNRFIGTTGVDPDLIRDAATAPTFLAAVMDYVMGDDETLIACATAAGLKPEEIGLAAFALDGGNSHWA